jgi:hypothetical protein
MPLSLDTAQYFRRTYYLLIEGRRDRPGKKSTEVGSKMLLQNVGLFLIYVALEL